MSKGNFAISVIQKLNTIITIISYDKWANQSWNTDLNVIIKIDLHCSSVNNYKNSKII